MIKQVFAARPDGQLRLSFFEAKVQTVVDGIINWRGRSQKVDRIESWSPAWHTFEISPTIDCVCQFSDKWSMHADNGESAISGFVYTLSRRMRVRAVRFCTMLPTGTAKYPSYSMEYHDVSLGEERAVDRQVGVYADKKWKFHSYGNPLSFETEAMYLRSRIQERITHEMLCDYAASLGLCLENEFSFSETFVIRNCECEVRVETPSERLAGASELAAQLGQGIAATAAVYAVDEDGRVVKRDVNLKRTP